MSISPKSLASLWYAKYCNLSISSKSSFCAFFIKITFLPTQNHNRKFIFLKRLIPLFLPLKSNFLIYYTTSKLYLPLKYRAFMRPICHLCTSCYSSSVCYFLAPLLPASLAVRIYFWIIFLTHSYQRKSYYIDTRFFTPSNKMIQM